jgi:hypothetical protein
MCEERQGIYQPQAAPKAVPYTPETHRALIALRCAKHSRPINSILDDDYRTEVEMLRPGTVLPHSTTVQRDLVDIYIHMSTFVMNYFMVNFFLLSIAFAKAKQYFQTLNTAVHIALDGWTSPHFTSYLGLVVIWYANGTINRAVLEFIRYLFY